MMKVHKLTTVTMEKTRSQKTKPSLCFVWLPSFINSLTFFVSQHNFGAALVALLLFIYYSMSADAAPAPN